LEELCRRMQPKEDLRSDAFRLSQRYFNATEPSSASG
jgi:hypothetical protein